MFKNMKVGTKLALGFGITVMLTVLISSFALVRIKHIDEVISSLHVHLTHNQVMEVILIQGHAHALQDIANEMITQRGVITGRLQLLAAVIPQLHVPEDEQ